MVIEGDLAGALEAMIDAPVPEAGAARFRSECFSTESGFDSR
jgi:hypothetical protein